VLTENAWYRVRGSRFRAFVHDVRRIEDALRSTGFRQAVSKRRLAWDLRVYVRGSEVAVPT
jgi:hypothetical protein